MGASMALALASAGAQPGGKGKAQGKGKGGPPAAAQKAKQGGGNAKARKAKGKPTPSVAKAKDKPTGNASNKGKPATKGVAKVKPEQLRFDQTDQERIRTYFSGFRDEENGLPPGLAMNVRRGKPLPPGWQKKISPGYIIEDDWWPNFQPIPSSWFPGMQAVPETALYRVGDRIVRVHEPRREILDSVIIPTIRGDW